MANPPETAELNVSVVICTYERPDALARCLDHLKRQSTAPLEVVVVDASSSNSTCQLVKAWPEVQYVRNDLGLGTLPQSRKIGFDTSAGDIVAYLDDDAYADPDWLEQLVAAYEPGIGGVVGQARRGQPNEDETGLDAIGKISHNGRCTGNFAAAPDGYIDVDHMIGCNMSVRRTALDAVGGPPDWPAGITGQREDLHISLLLTTNGWRLRFTPFASVYHEGAPTPKGQRLDLRYQFEGARNHVLVFASVYGLSSARTWRVAAAAAGSAFVTSSRSAAGAIVRFSAVIAGSIAGLGVALRQRLR